jgi:hypothetical protein
MSSSNLVALHYVRETEYNKTPDGVPFNTARYTSEGLSGTPQVTQSEMIAGHRENNGQVVVGMDCGGPIASEIAPSQQLEDFISGALMRNTPSVPAMDLPIAADVTVGSESSMELASGDFLPGMFEAGQIVLLSGFVNESNNGAGYVTSYETGTMILAKRGAVAETAAGASVKRPAGYTVGTDKPSFTFEKKFNDLTDKAIDYTGMLVNSMTLAFAYGEIATSDFGFMGAGYTVCPSGIPVTTGETINPAETTQPLNASIDIPGVIFNGEDAGFCFQNLTINLANGLTPSVCMGSITPHGYSLGSANVTVSASSYLVNSNFYMVEEKLKQTPVAIAFSASNADGGIAVSMPAVQLTFPDPSSQGRDQQVSLAIEGTAKYDQAAGNSITIYVWKN